MIPKIAKVSPLLFVCSCVFNVVDGFSFGLMTPVTQFFMDRATEFAAQRITIEDVLLALAFLGVCHIAKNAFNGVAYIINMFYMRKADGALSEEIHRKMGRISAIQFENTAVLDDMNKAVEGKECANRFVNSILLSLNVYIPYFISMSIYLAHTDPILVISLVFVFVPTFVTQILRAKLFAEAENQSAQVRREYQYYEECMIGRAYFKESRVNGAFCFFKGLYRRQLVKLNKLTYQAAAKSNRAEMITKLLSLAGYAGILLLLFHSFSSGKITAGAFAAIFASIGQMFSMMENLICKQYGSVAKEFGKVQNYLRFLDMPEKMGTQTTLPKQFDITLHHVSLTYPGGNRKAVDDVSLTIKNGESVAFVGENGSGKSTLMRLITGLYEPDEGEVRFGNTDIRTVSDNAVFKHISAVFQKYQRYQMTLRENIGISDIHARADGLILDALCEKAGVDKNGNGINGDYDTMLSRAFDGTELSGGEWQRVAIARSFFRQHSVIVLDEPTAAIDPIEETNVYRRFAETAKEKTALIVTHRLGSVQFADRIFVMQQGRLVEHGTHEELLERNGEYARLYQSQKQWYQLDNPTANTSSPC